MLREKQQEKQEKLFLLYYTEKEKVKFYRNNNILETTIF